VGRTNPDPEALVPVLTVLDPASQAELLTSRRPAASKENRTESIRAGQKRVVGSGRNETYEVFVAAAMFGRRHIRHRKSEVDFGNLRIAFETIL
jgi:hypothetical protein